MAEKQDTTYVIPLRREFLKVPRYKRTGRAVKAIKQFVAKHMKVPERDTSKVKLDIHFNNQLWFKGRTNPPTRVKVSVKKEKDNYLVDFVDTPEHVKFNKPKLERRHKKVEKKPTPAKEDKKETLEDKTQTEEEKKEEKEQAQSTAEANIKEAKQTAKAQKHTTKGKAPQIQRKALKK